MKLRLKYWRKRRRFTQEKLSEVTGESLSQISRWERTDISKPRVERTKDERIPDVSQILKLAKVLGIRPRDLFPDQASVAVVGRVCSRQEIFGIEDHEAGAGFYYVGCPDGLDPEKAVAVEVIEDSMLPLGPGWLVFFCRAMEYGPADALSQLLDQLCVVKTVDGKYFIKELRRGYESNTFNLISSNAGPMENVSIEWAAPVRRVIPKIEVALISERSVA